MKRSKEAWENAAKNWNSDNKGLLWWRCREIANKLFKCKVFVVFQSSLTNVRIYSTPQVRQHLSACRFDIRVTTGQDRVASPGGYE